MDYNVPSGLFNRRGSILEFPIPIIYTLMIQNATTMRLGISVTVMCVQCNITHTFNTLHSYLNGQAISVQPHLAWAEICMRQREMLHTTFVPVPQLHTHAYVGALQQLAR